MQAPGKIRVVIADDHPIFRHGLRQIVETDPALEVVAEAEDGNTAIKSIERTKADIAILDVDMPGRDGFEVVRILQNEGLRVQIIFLTMHKDERFLNAALDAGVEGYVLKDGAATEIIQSIKIVRSGQNYISPQLSTFLINRSRRAGRLASQKTAVESLTQAERQILKMAAAFKTNKEIAEKLSISVRTAEHHRENMAEKLGLHGSHALTRFAVQHESEL
jgi:DNA-binding NarL/FixJ family response regulator